MTYHDHIGFMSDVLMLLMVFIAQMLVAWIAISIANSWYFVNYVPDKTLVLSNNETYLSKVLNYLNSHQKQYELVEVIESPTLDVVNLNGVGKVFALELDHDFLTNLMKQSYMLDVELYYSSDFGNVIFGNRETFFVDDILLYQYQTRKMTDLQLFGKRLMDIVFSVLGLIVVFPVMLVVSLLIKLDDGGPIIFSQERLTRNGKVFNIYKFRSMKLNSGNQPVTKDDDRITRVGKFIRKFRLDELPQLFNIIKGDMSIVGPRPESVSIEEEILKEVPEFGFRLKVKAGLTGTAQIFGKYNTSARDKLLMDLYYIENFSLFNDLKLMFQTLIVFIKKDSTEGFDKDGK
ncbi:MAG: sugar transferase, partial [Erysipelothrix sp.]|nr:sugar transferase [Erysipelothrix sp.]